MRPWLLLAVALALIPDAIFAAALDRVRETGVVRLGYRADARPYSYRDAQGQPAGYVVDLCLEVANALGPKVRTEFVLVPADQRFEAVRDSKVDILCDPSSVTMQRREMVDFSLPVFIEGAAVISRIGKPVSIFEDLAGKNVGVLGGTTSEETLRKSLSDLGVRTNIVAVKDHRIGLDLLSEDKIDAYFADHGIIAAMLRDGARPGFQISKRYFSFETYALALPRDDGAFRLAVDRTLARLFRTGKIETILAKTFGQAPADDLIKALIVINSVPDR
jgi:ABC-type amino acid transport substrate-binding protein